MNLFHNGVAGEGVDGLAPVTGSAGLQNQHRGYYSTQPVLRPTADPLVGAVLSFIQRQGAPSLQQSDGFLILLTCHGHCF